MSTSAERILLLEAAETSAAQWRVFFHGRFLPDTVRFSVPSVCASIASSKAHHRRYTDDSLSSDWSAENSRHYLRL